MKIPVFRTPRSMSMVAVDLMLHGIVVADAMRPHNRLLAGELRGELGIKPDDTDDDRDFLLHLSCEVDPAGEYGWVDYYVYSATFPWTRCAQRTGMRRGAPVGHGREAGLFRGKAEPLTSRATRLRAVAEYSVI